MAKRKRGDFIGPQGPHARRYKKTKPNRAGYSSVARTRGAAVKGEMKYYDTSLTATALVATTTTWVAGTMQDPTGSINLGDPSLIPQCLFAPKATASLNGRIGRATNMMKIKLNGLISVPPQAAQAAADASTEVRVMLVMDTETNSAQMTGAQLMNDAFDPSGTLNSFQNPNNFGRFRVLKEKRFSISNLSITGVAVGNTVIQAGTARPFKMSHNFKKPVQVRFNATNGGTVADIINNSLHIVAAVNDATYVPTLSYYTRVSYKE